MSFCLVIVPGVSSVLGGLTGTVVQRVRGELGREIEEEVSSDCDTCVCI